MPSTIELATSKDGKRVSQCLELPGKLTPEQSQAVREWLASAFDKPGEIPPPPQLR